MADLGTRYLGLELKNPIVAGASALTSNIQTLSRIADAGAGAIVLSSLFEEQVQLSRYQMEEELSRSDDMYGEMTSMFPNIEHAGPESHLLWAKKAKEAVDIPVIASLNAVNSETWIEYAKRLVDTGVDALELNFYATPVDFDVRAETVEREQLSVLEQLRKNIPIPLSVKLSSFYSSPLNFIKNLDDLGVDGFVLFNRLFHPKIDIESESNDLAFNLSAENDYRLALRFAGLLYDQVQGDICASNGIRTAENVVEVLLAGAGAAQVVSTLFKNKIEYISVLVAGVDAWMDKKGYAEIGDFRGKLSKKNNPDPWTYSRAKYVKILRSPGQYLVK